MTSIRQIRNRILESGSGRDVLNRLGIDLNQYRLLLDLFETLGERLEFIGSFNTIAMGILAGWLGFFSLLISLTVFMGPTLHKYLFGILACTMLVLLLVLVTDAANSILNSDEASVLSHQPIGGATYVAAKLSHLLLVVTVVVSAVNVVPAFAGLYLKEARWFYPVTHLLAAYFSGLFLAFLVCGIFGWLLRFVAPARLKNVSLWLQVLVFLASPIFNITIQLLNLAKFKFGLLQIARSSWIPLNWFVALGLVGHSSHPGRIAWQGMLAVLSTIGFIVFGLRSFAADYLVRASTLVQGSTTAAARTSGWAGMKVLVRRLTGAPSGVGGFSFAGIMFRRDWHFRRQVFPAVLLWIILGVWGLVRGLTVSPFMTKSFSTMHLLPHLLGVVCLITCNMLSFTAEPHGSWIFLPLPLGQLRPLTRGIYLSLWIPVVGVTHLLLLGPCIWFWGSGPGILFVLFSALLASFYLSLTLFLIVGFPFTSPFDPAKSANLLPTLVVGLILAGLFASLQWLIFRNMVYVLGATLVLIVLTCSVAHWSLGNLEDRLRANLQVLALGPQRMFREIE